MYKLYEYKGKRYHIKLFAQMKNPQTREWEDCICYVQEETDMTFVREKLEFLNLFKEV
jgi:hypothetical protein